MSCLYETGKPVNCSRESGAGIDPRMLFLLLKGIKEDLQVQFHVCVCVCVCACLLQPC